MGPGLALHYLRLIRKLNSQRIGYIEDQTDIDLNLLKSPEVLLDQIPHLERIQTGDFSTLLKSKEEMKKTSNNNNKESTTTGVNAVRKNPCLRNFNQRNLIQIGLRGRRKANTSKVFQ